MQVRFQGTASKLGLSKPPGAGRCDILAMRIEGLLLSPNTRCCNDWRTVPEDYINVLGISFGYFSSPGILEVEIYLDASMKLER